MKKTSIGFAFLLLIGFQEVKAITESDPATEAKIADNCDRLLGQCKNLSMTLDVEKDPSKCKPCVDTCENAKSKDACYNHPEKLKFVSMHSLHCRKACPKTSASKKG